MIVYQRGCEEMQANHPVWVYFNTVNSHIKTDVVYDLLIDDTGGIWIASNIGVSRFNHETWRNYLLKDVEEIVSAPDGRIWATADGMGVYIWTNDRWDPVWQEPAHTIAFDLHNRAWIGVSNGVIILDADSLDLVNSLSFGDLVFGGVTEVGIDSLGQVHIRYSGDNLLFDADSFVPLDRNAYPVEEGKTFLISDNTGNAWFSSDNELVKSDGETITTYTPEKSSLPGHYVYELKIGPYGRTWLSTRSNQIAYLDSGKWITVVNDPFGWGENRNVRFPIDFDKDGNLWYGSHSGGEYGCGVIMIPRTSLPAP